MGNTDKDIHALLVKCISSSEFRELQRNLKAATQLQVLHLLRDEVSHTRIVAWILKGCGNALGFVPMRYFLDLIVYSKLEYLANKDGELPQDVLEVVLLRSRIISVSIETEKFVVDTQGKEGRVDIYVEITFSGHIKKLPVVIENKIDSREHDKQLINYERWTKTLPSEKFMSPLLIVITPNKTDALRKGRMNELLRCSSNKYVRINYQGFLDYVIEPCLEYELDSCCKHVLNDYLLSLERPSQFVKRKGFAFMAISKKTRKLVSEFWETNKEFLLFALSALSDDADINPSEQEDLDRVVDFIRHRSRNRYSINGSGSYNMRDLAYKVIEEYVRKFKRKSDIGKVFSSELHPGLGPLVKDKKPGNGSIHKFKELPYNGTVLYVSNQWTEESIKVFIEGVEKLDDFDIKIEKVV